MTHDAESGKDLLGTLSKEKSKLLQLLIENRLPTQSITQLTDGKNAEGEEFPTSWAQQQLWFIDQLEGGGAAYHISFMMRFKGKLDPRALQHALDALVLRHDGLRTAFLSVEGEPRQKIMAPGCLTLRLVNLDSYEGANQEALVQQHAVEEANGEFDLSVGPPIRSKLLRLHPEEHVLLVTMHHIVSDGWSVGIFVRELVELYDGCQDGRAHRLDPLPIQYTDYARWQRQWVQEEASDDHMRYWCAHLQDAAPELGLPTDRPRPSVHTYHGDNVQVSLNAELTAALRTMARRHGITLFMLLYAGWAILLSRLSGQADIVIGTPAANRQRPELEGLIGLFVNTLALRIEVAAEKLFVDFLEQIREVTLQAYDHQELPFEQLVKVLRPQRSLSRNPIFQVMFALQRALPREWVLPEVKIEFNEVLANAAKFDLLLLLEEGAEEISGTLNFDTDLYDRDTIERWKECFTVLLKGMVASAQNRVADLPVLPHSERLKVIKEFNATQMAVPHEKLVHELVEEQARLAPDVVAVVCGNCQLTYRQLNQRANQLARVLVKSGVSSDNRVAICAERSVEMIVGMLAILKAGGAYVPLDVKYPAERLAHMLRDSAPMAILTHERIRKILPVDDECVILLDAGWNEISKQPDDNVSVAHLKLRPQNLAYVIYTSGSTGTPKGVMVDHRNLVNLIHWHCAAFDLRAGCRSSCVAAVGFDAASWEIWPPLAVGATLVVAASDVIDDAEALLMWWAAEPLDVSFLPTPMAELAFSRNIRNEALRTLLVGGDRLTHYPASRSFSLVNNYGPTESTVVASSGRIHEADSIAHIGRPIANTQIYILDRFLQPVPIGVAGEIYIGGAGVARGYLNRAEQEAERFITDPFSGEAHARMYCTGDLARWRKDGTIEFLGRNDEQVKIRGFRIELGEIEAQLVLHEQVKEAAAVVRDDPPGGKRLVAYVTCRDAFDVGVDGLRMYLKSVLPDYMIPSAIVRMKSFPLTLHGKLDRRALPAPALDAYVSQRYEAPQGEVEKVLADIWQELLDVTRFGRKDNFFDLGGHSLLAVKSVFKVNQRLASAVRVADIYRNPTIRELAAHIGGRAAADEVVELSREAALEEDIVVNSGTRAASVAAVLLTGATGFVGRFLLAQLLRSTSAVIYCLVRASSDHHASSRLRASLSKWDLWKDEFASRVIAIPGDLRRARLGIDANVYEDLCGRIDSIYHCATSMNHLETYAMAKPANVGAIKELLKFSTTRKTKLVNYISTLGVFGPSPSGELRIVREGTPIESERHWSSTGYVTSKWVGEKMCMAAAQRGIPCNIFRLGLVWADTAQGRYDELQHAYRVLKTCILSGYGIQNYSFALAPTPVDYVAHSVVFLANRHLDGGGTFHISSSSRAMEAVFEMCNEAAGTSLELIPHYEWICKIKQFHAQGWLLPAVPLLEFAFSMDEQAFHDHQRNSWSASVRFDCARTHAELAIGGIEAPPINGDLMRVCLEGMFATDAELQGLAERQGYLNPTRHGRGSCANDLSRRNH